MCLNFGSPFSILSSLVIIVINLLFDVYILWFLATRRPWEIVIRVSNNVSHWCVELHLAVRNHFRLAPSAQHVIKFLMGLIVSWVKPAGGNDSDGNDFIHGDASEGVEEDGFNHKSFNLDLSGNLKYGSLTNLKQLKTFEEINIRTISWDSSRLSRGLYKGAKVYWVASGIAEAGLLKWIGQIKGIRLAGLQLDNKVTVTIEGVSGKRLFSCKKRRGRGLVFLDQVVPEEKFLSKLKMDKSRSPSCSDKATSTTSLLKIDTEEKPSTSQSQARKSILNCNQDKDWGPGDRILYPIKKNSYEATILRRTGTKNGSIEFVIEFDEPVGDHNFYPTSDLKFRQGHGKKLTITKLMANAFITLNKRKEPPYNHGSSRKRVNSGRAEAETSNHKRSKSIVKSPVSATQQNPVCSTSQNIPGSHLSNTCKASNMPVNNHEEPLPLSTADNAPPKMPRFFIQKWLRKFPSLSLPKLTGFRAAKANVDGLADVNAPRTSEKLLGEREGHLMPASIVDQVDHRRRHNDLTSDFGGITQVAKRTHFQSESKSSAQQNLPSHSGESGISESTTLEGRNFFGYIKRQFGLESQGDSKNRTPDKKESALVGKKVAWLMESPQEKFVNGTVISTFTKNGFLHVIVDLEGVQKFDLPPALAIRRKDGYYAFRVDELMDVDASVSNLGCTPNALNDINLGFQNKNATREDTLDENENADSPPLNSRVTHINEKDILKLCGRRKGIQGMANSCYLDASLFSMFFCTKIFDECLFTPRDMDDDLAKGAKLYLKNDIVDTLRESKFVSGGVVMKFRRSIVHFNKRLLGYFMDAEDFMFILLEKTLKSPHFFTYDNGMSDYMHQIFAPTTNGASRVSTVQKLFETSMEYNGDLKFKEIPSPALIIQLPRSNGKFVGYDWIVPSLQLDVSKVMEGWEGNLASYEPRNCLCDRTATVACSGCDKDAVAFCAGCVRQADLVHDNVGHPFSRQTIIPSKCIKMNLIAVVCVAHCHYTAYAKYGQELLSPWLHFDSSGPAIRQVPEVSKVLLDTENAANNAKLHRNRFGHRNNCNSIFTDCHICIYQPPPLHL